MVILHDRAGRRYRLRLAPGATYSLHSGSVEHDSLIGQPDASLVTTNRGTRLLAPDASARIMEFGKRTRPLSR